MTIKIGDKLPDAAFITMSEDGPVKVTTGDLFSGKKVVLFAVPGAFTPTCHMNHLPGFLENHEAIRSRGVDEIAVVAVNDVHVMKAWADATGGKGKIVFLSDGAADFTKAVGLEIDLSAVGMGIRSKRYSMIVEDGVLKALNVEEKPGAAEVSGAAAILTQI